MDGQTGLERAAMFPDVSEWICVCVGARVCVCVCVLLR